MDPLLSVRVTDDTGTDRLMKFRGLGWRKTSSGGWVEMHTTLTADDSDLVKLGPNNRIYAYDRFGQCSMEGYLDNPGLTKGPLGSEFQVSANGPAALAGDHAYPHVLITQDAGDYEWSSESTKNANASTSEIDADTPALEATATQGTNKVGTTWRADYVNRVFYQAGMDLARVSAVRIAGVNDAAFKQQIVTREDPAGGGTVVANLSASTTSSAISAVLGTILTGHNIFSFRTDYQGASATDGLEAHWFQVYDFVARAVLKDLTGADIVTGYSQDWVYAHEIVTDMIGRGILPGVDPAHCTIDATTAHIDQWSYPGGITGGGGMEALQLIEYDTTWGYRRSTGNGHEFWARQWNDEPEYVLQEDLDGVKISGGDNDLCNRIVLTYTDRKGHERTVIRTSVVPALGNRVRDAEPVTLPPEFGTQEKAEALGDAILARKATPPRAGVALVRRPIQNLRTGLREYPHEIEPGRTVLLMGTGEVIRMPEMTYEHDARAAVLTLGAPRLSAQQLLARMTRRSRILTAKEVKPGTLSASHHLKGTKVG